MDRYDIDRDIELENSETHYYTLDGDKYQLVLTKKSEKDSGMDEFTIFLRISNTWVQRGYGFRKAWENAWKDTL